MSVPSMPIAGTQARVASSQVGDPANEPSVGAEPVVFRRQRQLASRLARATLIEQAKQQWEATADLLPELLFLLDRDNCVVRVNRTLERWQLGHVAEVRGRGLHGLLHPSCPDRACAVTDFLASFAPDAGSGAPLEREGYDPILSRHLRLTARPFSAAAEGGRDVARIVVITDITAQQRFQEELEASVAERSRELIRANENLCSLHAQLQSAQEQERQRIAGALHDSVSQSLTAMKFGAEQAISLLRGDKGKDGLRLLDALIPRLQDTMEEVRRISMDLHPAILDDLGLVAALAWLCRDFGGPERGIELTTRFAVREADIPNDLKTIIYRVAQEGLNNVLKHARASHVQLLLVHGADDLTLLLEDDGVGFDPAAPRDGAQGPCGLGLRSMRQRAEFSGATFSLTSRSGAGTRVEARWGGDALRRNGPG